MCFFLKLTSFTELKNKILSIIENNSCIFLQLKIYNGFKFVIFLYCFLKSIYLHLCIVISTFRILYFQEKFYIVTVFCLRILFPEERYFLYYNIYQWENSIYCVKIHFRGTIQDYIYGLKICTEIFGALFSTGFLKQNS